MAKLLTKDFKRKILANIVPPILYVVLYFIFFTCRKKYHFEKEKVINSACIFVLWHGELMMGPFIYLKYRNENKIDVIISEHGDGEIASRFVSLLGGGTIRGSSTRGGIKALRKAFTSISQNRDIGIAVDGPKGPRHSVGPGVISISQKKSVPIVTLNYNASSFWQLKSWDKFTIPKPFCKLDFYYSEPFFVTGDNLEEAQEKIKSRLMKHAI